MCRMLLPLCVLLAFGSTPSLAIADDAKPANLMAGAALVDITPTVFPVIVNGMVEERTAGQCQRPHLRRAVGGGIERRGTSGGVIGRV